jgi:pimeloyl-ACP methyl ester carboxylesterase
VCVLKTFNITSMHLIAESQACPGAVILARDKPDIVRNIALIRPLGFSVQALGESDEARMRVFRRRFLKSALQFSQSLLHDVRNASIALTMIKMTLREPSVGSFNKKYAVGVSYDLIEYSREVAKQQQLKHAAFVLILGEKDRLFPPKEVFGALTAADIKGLTVHVVPRVGHASLAVKASRTTLKQALEAVREDLSVPV